MEIGNWSTDAGRLDILQRIGGSAGQFDYAELRRSAIEVTDETHAFLVASLADIADSKRAAARPKDLEALRELDRLLADRDSLGSGCRWACRSPHAPSSTQIDR
jgi:HD superfamily phosphodiesterase